MQRALTIETSGRIGSVALVERSALVEEVTFPHALQHAAGIVCMIDDLCRRHRWGPRDIEEIYLSHGPGSFTGLRIGVTLAKTLAFATGAKIVAVPSVRVLAANAPLEARNLIIVLDAKRGQVFTARFARDGHRWIEIESARLDRLSEMLRRSPRPVHLLGEGLPYHMESVGKEEVLVTPPETWAARAAVVAQEGIRMAERGEFTDPDQLTPLYIRRPEAEEKWDSVNRTVPGENQAGTE